jgi:hypothetical protein
MRSNYNCESNPHKAAYFKFKEPIVRLLQGREMYAKDILPLLNEGLPVGRQCTSGQVKRALIELKADGLVIDRDSNDRRCNSKLWRVICN